MLLQMKAFIFFILSSIPLCVCVCMYTHTHTHILIYRYITSFLYIRPLIERESHSVMSESLPPHGLYIPCNSPGQNTGVGSLSNLGSPVLQADYLPAEPQGKPIH